MSWLALVLSLFTFYLLSTLLPTFSAVFGLIHSSNPCVTDLTDSPSTKISSLLQWLQLLWLCHVSVDKFQHRMKPYGCLSSSITNWGKQYLMKLLRLGFIDEWHHYWVVSAELKTWTPSSWSHHLEYNNFILVPAFYLYWAKFWVNSCSFH